LANRGGWGCDRILPLLDYELIAKNPKIIMGYSDLTSLLHAIHFQTGLVTFYGPMGIDNWQNYNGKYFSQVVMEGKKVLFRNPNSSSLNITTITGGKAKGKLYGGNLSVFNTLIGTPFLPNTIDWTKVILFLEDTNEEPYRIDRMIVTLKLAGILDSIAGFVWGICNSCSAANPSQSFTLQEVIESHVKPLGIPAFSGSMIGHISEQFTLPIGIEVELDADQGTILMLETSVLG
jgi:muramoyltetrapeptide carboxypeptidase